MRTVLALLIAAAVAGAALAGAAVAQSTRGTTSALEENRREARALAEMLDIPRQTEALIARMRAEIIAATMRTAELPEAEAAAIVDDILMPNFRARGTELVAEMVEPYALNFTITDLKALRAFFITPLGQKLLRTQPIARAQGEQAGLAWGQRVFQDSVDRHADELRARGLKF